MEQTIEFQIPEGYVFDKDNSTENVIRFKPIKKKITYQDVKEKLFPDSKSMFYLGKEGGIMQTFSIKYHSRELLVSTSQQQLQQIRALNKLMNVAKYLNGDWIPRFVDRGQKKWCIYYDFENFKWNITNYIHYRQSAVYFKSKELAWQAIEILGEEEVKKALGVE